jgi:general secretion pathway protein C
MANRLLLRTLSGKQAVSADVHRWLVPLATALALALAAWVATDWFWYFKATKRSAPPAGVAQSQQADARMLSDAIATSSLFGTGRTMVAAPTTANVKLKGIIASGPGGTSAAIMNTGTRDEVVPVGSDVVPGLALEAVYPTHVLVKRGGRIERVDLEAAKGGPAAQLGLAVTPRPASVPIAPAPQGMRPGLAPPIGTPNPAPPQNPPGSPLGQSNPNTAATGRLGMTSAGPTVEEAPPGSLLARIGLQQGDVIKSIDGRPVQAGRDMVRLFEIANTGQTVQGEVLRGGQTISMQIGLQR